MKTVMAHCSALLAVSLCAAASTCAVAASYKTSFDCAGTRMAVEKLICSDAQLARMDIELNRLYRLALTDEHAEPRPDKVLIDQQFWVEARNQCASDREPRACTIRSYAERAYQLRRGSAIVRTRDPDRLTEGPLAFSCAGLNAKIDATFFITQPGVVYLKWASSSITLSQVPSEMGARYTGKDVLGTYSFWQNGDMAMFQKPGSGEMTCKAEPAG
ncbi:MliC family protein [Pseudomonas sp. NPDC089569]|uniref:MliC family protein n=1 Tax=Pseudomonas sp. NPDC089569 TaxID=3390722 RepID=UPI003D01308D